MENRPYWRDETCAITNSTYKRVTNPRLLTWIIRKIELEEPLFSSHISTKVVFSTFLSALDFRTKHGINVRRNPKPILKSLLYLWFQSTYFLSSPQTESAPILSESSFLAISQQSKGKPQGIEQGIPLVKDISLLVLPKSWSHFEP